MEKSINKVELSGFAGIDPEVKTMSNGKNVMRFTLATSRSYKNKKDEWERETTWHNIVLWGKLCEGLAEHQKRQLRETHGRSEQAIHRQSGVKHSVYEIHAFAFETVEIEKKAESIKAA